MINGKKFNSISLWNLNNFKIAQRLSEQLHTFFGKVWKLAFGKLLDICGSSWDVFRNSCHNRTKISCLINLTQKELASIYWHVCICIKDNHARQEEPAILISRLLLHMHCMYVAIRLDIHKECMECTECTLSTCIWTLYHS